MYGLPRVLTLPKTKNGNSSLTYPQVYHYNE